MPTSAEVFAAQKAAKKKDRDAAKLNQGGTKLPPLKKGSSEAATGGRGGKGASRKGGGRAAGASSDEDRGDDDDNGDDGGQPRKVVAKRAPPPSRTRIGGGGGGGGGGIGRRGSIGQVAIAELSTTEAFAARTIRLPCRVLFLRGPTVFMRDRDAWVQRRCSAGRVLCAQLPPDSQV